MSGRTVARSSLVNTAGAGTCRIDDDDLTLIDMHEAFAAQTLANIRCWVANVLLVTYWGVHMPLASGR